MSRPTATQQDAPRVESLLRSLVGVADVRLDWNGGSSLRGVHILRAAGTQHHQLVRNIISGLKAGFGIVLSQVAVHVHESADLMPAVAEPAVPAKPQPAVEVAPPPAAAPAAPTREEVAAVQKPVNPRPPAHPLVSTPLAARPAHAAVMGVPVRRADAREVRERDADDVASATGSLQLERMDVERHGAALRCRVVLSLAGRQYSAIAEVPDSATAEAELAARVTVDALRAGSLTDATLHGVGFITVGGTSFVVVTVREGHAAPPRAGAVALDDSMAWSAAVAVLNAVGPITSKRLHEFSETAGK